MGGRFAIMCSIQVGDVMVIRLDGVECDSLQLICQTTKVYFQGKLDTSGDTIHTIIHLDKLFW